LPRKNLLLLVALLLVASVLAAALLLTRFGLPLQANPSPTSKPSPTPSPTPFPAIIRSANTMEEKRALAAVEDLNATEAFNMPPFTWNGYAYANFIDSEVINYYNSSYESARETVQFSYSANVYTWNQTHAVYDKVSGSASVSSSNGTIWFPSAGRYAYLNSSRYQEIKVDKIDFSFSNCYVVEMNLGYSQFLGPTAGFSCNVYQIVIVNEDFKPILLCTQSQHVIS
jgi:hypothetical protein